MAFSHLTEAPIHKTPSNESNGEQLRNASGTDARLVQIKAHSVSGSGPDSPESASTRSAYCHPATNDLPVANEPTPETSNDHKVLVKVKAFFNTLVDVRRENKKEFEKKREELRKEWPEFDKVYDDYRQWRDSPEDQRGGLEGPGRKAQLEIMKRSGVTDSEKMHLFALLESSDPPSDLLRFISPVNGDFRAPKEGIIGGLRFTDEGGKMTPTLAFPGTGAGSMIRAQLRTNFRQFIGKGGLPTAHQLGAKLAQQCRDQLKKQDPNSEPLALTGHSLGGGIASCAAAHIADPQSDFKPRCYTFNPAALGGATLKALEALGDLAARTENHVIIRVKKDQVSSMKMQRFLAAFLTLQTQKLIIVPRHLGKMIVIPLEALDKSKQNALMAHSLESQIPFFLRLRPTTDMTDGKEVIASRTGNLDDALKGIRV